MITFTIDDFRAGIAALEAARPAGPPVFLVPRRPENVPPIKAGALFGCRVVGFPVPPLATGARARRVRVVRGAR